MLEIKNLSARYRAVQILNKLSFSITGGEFAALLGPNGTGKSTLLKAIAGLISAEGDVSFDKGTPIPPPKRGQTIAYMPQDTGASSSLTVLEVVLLGQLKTLGLHVPNSLVKDAEQMLSCFELDAYSARTLDAISGGQRQLVYLAQSLFRNPKVLLLDEPTAALDLRYQLIVLDRVIRHCRQKGTIAIAAMHDLSLAAKCADRVICLSDGKIVADGPPHENLTKALIRRVYGVETEIVVGPSGVLHIAPVEAIEVMRVGAAL